MMSKRIQLAVRQVLAVVVVAKMILNNEKVKLKTKVKLCLLSWLAGVLVMAEETQEGSSVTGRRRRPG